MSFLKFIISLFTDEVLDITHPHEIQHPLNPLRLKCESGFGTSMMCFTY